MNSPASAAASPPATSCAIVMMAETEDIAVAATRNRSLPRRSSRPLVERGMVAFLAELDGVTVDDLCAQRAGAGAIDGQSVGGFHNLDL